MRRNKKSADDEWPVKNLPDSEGFLRPPQYADRSYDLLAISPGMTKYNKIRGYMSEDIGNQMLMKQRIWKPAFLSQDQIATNFWNDSILKAQK